MVLKTSLCANIENIRVQGRTAGKKSPIVLFWTGSAVEINVTGTELYFEYECEYNGSESYIRIEVDGADIIRQMLEEGKHTICVYRNMGEEDIKNVRIYREMQANSTVIKILSFTTDGKFMPLPERKYKIEILGDSVTSGEGLAGAKTLMRWIPYVFSNRDNYALQVVKALDADWSIVSQSGWGVYTSWANNIQNAIPLYYEYVCGVNKNPSQLALGAGELYNFEERHPDITIVNLGSNDTSAFGGQPWTDPDGVVHHLRRNDDKSFNREDLKLITDAIYNFCVKIRKYNPDTIILWCYNMLTNVINEDVIDAVERFKSDYNDCNAYTVKLPQADKALNGSRGHPGPLAHKMYADAIIKKLKEILK